MSGSCTSLCRGLPAAAALPECPDLPDPLTMRDGRRVADAAAWRTERRPELRALFGHYMYGHAPAPPAAVAARLVREDRGFLGGRGILREVSLRYGSPGTPPLGLLLALPAWRRGPAPVLVGANFHGNHALLEDPAVALPECWMPEWALGVVEHRATAAGRGAQLAAWPFARAVERGWAMASFHCGEVVPDRDGRADGVPAAYARAGRPAGAHDWGAVRAWAWGIGRAVDHLASLPELDATRIVAVGHSRLGKAALLAAACDERLAMAVPIQAGCGGSAPSRGTVGESVAELVARFPHWFCAEFRRFAGCPARLPFDQHCLVALVAPRPVLFLAATEDLWANPAGQFAVLRAADPVYRLLGADGLAAAAMPPPGVTVPGPLGYHLRPGGHQVTPADWDIIFGCAEAQLGVPDRPRNGTGSDYGRN